MDLNKGISTSIAILLIITVSAVVGVLVWQFKGIESPKPEPTELQATTSEEIILRKINKSLPEECNIEYKEIEKENWYSNSPGSVTLQKNICPEIKNYEEEKIWKAKKKISDNITAISLTNINLVASEDYFICNYAQDLRAAPGIKELRDVCADRTADWKTYTNEEYGFKIKYPGNWKISDPSHVFLYADEVEVPAEISIEIEDNPAQLPLKDWLKKNREATITKHMGEVTVDGIKGKKVSELGITGYAVVYFPKGNYVYSISTPEDAGYKEAFNKVVSTFEFVD